MNPYDLAHQLARAMKESEEYREYERLRETAYEDETNRALLDEYKRLQFRMQAKMASGESMPERAPPPCSWAICASLRGGSSAWTRELTWT